jgi:hypothetical protein
LNWHLIKILYLSFSRRILENDEVANYLPPDVIVSIVNKTYDNIKSFFALKNKGIKCNIPKFLDETQDFILKFDKQSKRTIKIGNKYFIRLSLGKKIANNYIDIIDNTACLCLNPNDIYKRYLFGHFIFHL